MTTLLLKNKRNYLNGFNSSVLMERRERERETRAQTQTENSEKLQGYIFVSLFQFKVPRTNCEQIALPSSSRACEHVHLIYEIGYSYEDRR